MQNLKIPVVSGVNDNPIPPNFNNNRLGCNGSYVVQKHNLLVDVLNMLNVEPPDFNIANLPTYLDLGEPLTTLSTPLTFYFQLEGGYANYFHGDSVAELEPLIGTAFESGSLYDHYYSDIYNQPNTYIVPHTRVFARNIYEANSGYFLRGLSANKQVSWKPKVVIGSSALSTVTNLSQLSTIHYYDFGVPTTAVDLPANLYSYVMLPSNTQGVQCYEPLTSIYAGSEYVNITPNQLVLTKTSSLGLSIQITYEVYKLAIASEPYKLWLNRN
jgi:hypothetical protein